MDTICQVIFYFLCYSDHSVSTDLFPLSFPSCCSGWILYILIFSISSATRNTKFLLIYFPFPSIPAVLVCLLIYFPFPLLPAALDGHYISSHFLFPLLLRSQCVYLFIFPFLDILLYWMDTIYPVIFYFHCYSDHSVSNYLFSLSFPFCCSGWTLYVLSFSISSVTRITVFLLIYFLFPLLPAVLYGHYISSHFIFPQLLGSQRVYLFIFPFLYFLLFWMDAIYPVIFYFLCYSDSSVSTYLFPLSLISCCSGWTLYVPSFSISIASRITLCLLIYFPFPWLPAVLAGYYISCHFLFPLLLGSQCVYLFISPLLSFLLSGWTIYIQSFSIFFVFGSQCVYIFISPFLSFLLFWMDTIYPVIFYFLCYSDHSLSIYLFSHSLPSCCLVGHYISSQFLFYLLLGSQCVYLFISPFLSSCCSGWTLYVQSFYISPATRITVCLLIYFPFPLLPAVLDGYYISRYFLFPQQLG